MLHPLHSVRFTEGSILTLVFIPMLFIVRTYDLDRSSHVVGCRLLFSSLLLAFLDMFVEEALLCTAYASEVTG